MGLILLSTVCVRVIVYDPRGCQPISQDLEFRASQNAKFRDVVSLEGVLRYIEQGFNATVITCPSVTPLHLEVIQKILRRHPNHPIILVSEQPSLEEGLLTVRVGVTDYLEADNTDGQILFDRILLASEKSRNTLRVAEQLQPAYLEVAAAQSDLASEDNSSLNRAAIATAELSRQIFADLQRVRAELLTHTRQIEEAISISKKVAHELFEGSDEKESIKVRFEDAEREIAEIKQRIRCALDPNSQSLCFKDEVRLLPTKPHHK